MYLHAYVRANKQQSLECPLAKWMVSSRIRILILDFNLSLMMTNNYIVETDIWTTAQYYICRPLHFHGA